MESHFYRDTVTSQPLFRTPSGTRSSSNSRRYYNTAGPIHHGIPPSSTLGQLPLSLPDEHATNLRESWTASSVAGLSDFDEVQGRPEFVEEYNRLASEHGIRILAPEDEDPCPRSHSPQQEKKGWFSRTFLRQPSSETTPGLTKGGRKRSVGELAMNIVQPRKDSLKDEDLQSLVRLCGKSLLHLPPDYAPSSLILPTCFRATAHYLALHAADTRGVFRIPGSVRVINALYDYYCAEGDPDEISSTTRCPNLPPHIKAGTHDIASAFKRFLSGLPGGVLGSVPLFDAFVAIHSQLWDTLEAVRTKQAKLRARLVALAVGSVRSQFRRELICAVFGLLCLIGHTAETAPSEDEYGNAVSTTDLMGYEALGIVFGPLLAGDIINSFTLKVDNDTLSLYPTTPPLSRKERRKSKVSDEDGSRMSTVDKIHVANAITEMLISDWREVVKQMRSLGTLNLATEGPRVGEGRPSQEARLRPSISESFVLRKPAEWSGTQHHSTHSDKNQSPVPPSPTPEPRRLNDRPVKPHCSNHSTLVVQRARPKGARSISNSRATKSQVQVLSPTAEEPVSANNDRSKADESCAVAVPYLGGREDEPTGAELDYLLKTATSTPYSAKNGHVAGNMAGIVRKVPAAASPPVPPRHRKLIVSGDSIRFANELEPLLQGPKEDEVGEDWCGGAAPVSLTGSAVGESRSKQAPDGAMPLSNDDQFRTTICRLRKSLEQEDRPNNLQRPEDQAMKSSPPVETRGAVSQEESDQLNAFSLKRSRLPRYRPNHFRGGGPSPGNRLGRSPSKRKGQRGSQGLYAAKCSPVILTIPDHTIPPYGSQSEPDTLSLSTGFALIQEIANTEMLPKSAKDSHGDKAPADLKPATHGTSQEISTGSPEDSSVGTVVRNSNHGQGYFDQISQFNDQATLDNLEPGPPATPDSAAKRSVVDTNTACRIHSTPSSPPPLPPEKGSAVKVMAARFESAWRETGYIPSPVCPQPGSSNPSPSKGFRYQAPEDNRSQSGRPSGRLTMSHMTRSQENSMNEGHPYMARSRSESPSKYYSMPSSPEILQQQSHTNTFPSGEASDTAFACSGSTSLMLHAHIRDLRVQLTAKAAEVQQMRRLQNTEVTILREQLRSSENLCATWKERAEAAERRLDAFERLAAGLRKFRPTGGNETLVDNGRLRQRGANGFTSDGAADEEREAMEQFSILAEKVRERQAGGLVGHAEDEGL